MSHATSSHGGNRREDFRLITGKGRYPSDWTLPGQAHAAFLRSDRAHAEIVAIDAARALSLPGVLAVFTGADAVAAAYTKAPLLSVFTNRAGGKLASPPRPVLSHGKVRFVGEAIALVVAETAALAADALDAIEVAYRDLPAAVNPDDALGGIL